MRRHGFIAGEDEGVARLEDRYALADKQQATREGVSTDIHLLSDGAVVIEHDCASVEEAERADVDASADACSPATDDCPRPMDESAAISSSSAWMTLPGANVTSSAIRHPGRKMARPRRQHAEGRYP
jgi:hypothetical protein